MERWGTSLWAQRELLGGLHPRGLVNHPCPSVESLGLLAAADYVWIAQEFGISVPGQALQGDPGWLGLGNKVKTTIGPFKH